MACLVVGAGSPSSASAPPEATLRGATLTETRDGAVLWEATAARSEIFEAEQIAQLARGAELVRVVIHSGEGLLMVEAQAARVNLRTRDIEFTGPVAARSERGVRLETDVLRWVDARRLLTSDRPVVIERGGLRMHGKGMEAAQALEAVRLLGDVRSEILVPAAPTARVAPAWPRPARAAGAKPRPATARSVTKAKPKGKARAHGLVRRPRRTAR